MNKEFHQIITKGLEKGAVSLSFFMKEELSFSGIEKYEDLSQKFFSPSYSDNDDFVLLITDIIGDVKGKCFLVFTDAEARKLLHISLYPNFLDDKSGRIDNMAEAILLEVDNIVSASVITELSNSLTKKMYGGVPSIQLLKGKELNDFLKRELIDVGTLLNFGTTYSSRNGNFKPDFVWSFDSEFLMN